MDKEFDLRMIKLDRRRKRKPKNEEEEEPERTEVDFSQELIGAKLDTDTIKKGPVFLNLILILNMLYRRT